MRPKDGRNSPAHEEAHMSKRVKNVILLNEAAELRRNAKGNRAALDWARAKVQKARKSRLRG